MLGCFIKLCNTAVTLPRELVQLVLVPRGPVQALASQVPVPVPVPELVPEPPLWGALPVSSAHNQPQTKTALRTSASKE
jgi:hypothetical protein